jgi:protein TonB
MREQEKVHTPRGWAGGTAWQGAGASLLLHLVVGAAVILTLSGPPKGPPQVIDLTLLPPAGIDRTRGPSAFHAAVKPRPAPKGNLLPEPAPLTAPQSVANPSEAPAAMGSAAAPSPTAAAGNTGILTPGSPHADGAAQVVSGPGPVTAVAGIPQGAASGPSTADFAWIRDAIQHAIAYPATARRMGWEGKVVVAFQLLSDGSVRDVRVVQGSGHAALDRGAIDAVRNAAPFPRAPVEAEVITPVVYRLTTR